MGGMAEIWSAIDTQAEPANNDLVALKVLLPELAVDPSLRTMFMDEVRLTMRLQHPNIVRVDGVFEVDHYLFHSMELLDGKDVRRLLSAAVQAGQRFPVSIALKIASATARALSYAHALKSDAGTSLEIVHRDISPHNILVCSNGTIKVLDFGIARAKERATKTAQGVIKGKLSYMAPEQAVAQPVSAQTDVFSLGIVLWEMLAMRRLFVGSSDAVTLGMVCEAQVPSLKEIYADLPDDLCELVHKMLALKPRHRTESMRAVDDGLMRVLYQLDNDVHGDEAVESWVAPFLEERPSTQVRSPVNRGLQSDEGLKKTRAEGHTLDKTEAYSVSSPDFSLETTTAVSTNEAGPKTGTTTPSPVIELKTEALDVAEISQTIQEPGETEHLPLPSTAEVAAALEDVGTFETDFSAQSLASRSSRPNDGVEDVLSADTSFSSAGGLVVGKVGQIITDRKSSAPIDPLAATSLYEAARRVDPAGRSATLTANEGERLRTKSGSLLLSDEDGDHEAKTAKTMKAVRDDSPEPPKNSEASAPSEPATFSPRVLLAFIVGVIGVLLILLSQSG